MSSTLNIGEVFPNAPATTNAYEYFEPLRLDIEWWNLTQTEKIHSFSSWDPSGTITPNHISVISASVTPPGTSQYGSFAFTIYDTDHVIDSLDARRKGYVVLKAKKYENDPYQNLITGFISKISQQRKSNELYYNIYGSGSGSLLNERFINMQRTAKMRTIDSDTPLFDDPAMEVRKLFKEMLSQRNNYVADDISITEHFNPPMDVSSLDNSIVNDTVLSLNEPYVQASHCLNAMLDGIGADGGIDHNNKPYLTFPLSRTPSITLKKWDENAEQGLDKATNTAYFMEDFTWEMDWSQESGFANRIFAKSRVTQGASTTSTDGSYGGFETLQNMDLAQKIPPSPSKFRDLAVIVSRVGNGTSKPATVKNLHGHIIQDNNGSPTGPDIARFDIPLSAIPDENPTPMFLSGLTLIRSPDPSRAHWIVLYDRGDPSMPDTINWFFNTDETLTGEIARRATIAGAPWFGNHENDSGWEITTGNAFNFAFSALDSFTHIIVGEDVESQERYGVVEDLIDLSWATNTIAATKALGEIVNMRCLPKVTYNTNAVTIPGILYMPGMIVRLEDQQSGLTSTEGAMAEITNVTYQFGGTPENPLGALTADLNLVGHYDFKVEEGFV
jgi:hypothetical protein